MSLLIAAAAVVGLTVGSFLNVVIWRVPRGESVVTPGSHCPGCGHAVRPRDNVPVLSWLLLRGRCRDCRASISVRYPLVELLTAAVFALLAWRIGWSAALPAFLYLGGIGVALAMIDLDCKRLPNALTLPSYGIGLALLGAAAAVDGGPWPLLRALIGMAALYVFYFALVVIYPAGMGFGDVKLAGVLGLYLGYLGWAQLVTGAMAGFLLGGLTGAVLLATRRAGRRSAIPFGPFMIAGALIAVCAGQQIADLYLRMTLG